MLETLSLIRQTYGRPFLSRGLQNNSNTGDERILRHETTRISKKDHLWISTFQHAVMVQGEDWQLHLHHITFKYYLTNENIDKGDNLEIHKMLATRAEFNNLDNKNNLKLIPF